jgi:hypothetical protein
MKDKSCRRSHGGLVQAEAPRWHPGGLQGTSGRHQRGPQEMPRISMYMNMYACTHEYMHVYVIAHLSLHLSTYA